MAVPSYLRGLLALLAVACARGSQIESVVKSYFELQAQGACEAWADLFAPSFSVTDPHGTAPITSIATLKSACSSANETFSEVNLEATAIFPLHSNDGAGATWRCGSVTRAKGCVLDFGGVDTFAFDEKLRIVKVDGFFDVSLPEKQMQC